MLQICRISSMRTSQSTYPRQLTAPAIDRYSLPMSDDLSRLIWCALIGLFRSRAALEAEILSFDTNSTCRAHSVLIVIETNPGRSRAAIGRALNIERARLARLLHELERRNWVQRRASASDGVRIRFFSRARARKPWRGSRVWLNVTRLRRLSSWNPGAECC